MDVGVRQAIVSYRTGNRDSENTDLFIQDLRERVIGAPEISTDGFPPCKNAIRDAFMGRLPMAIVKTYSVTNLAVKDAARRYSPAEVVAVSGDVPRRINAVAFWRSGRRFIGSAEIVGAEVRETAGKSSDGAPER